MNPATQPIDPAKPVQAPAASTGPTSQGLAATPQSSAAPLTHSFHPTIPLSVSEPEATHPGIQLGANLDGYVLLEQIGRGGMGIVFKARQPNSEQVVALKMIRDGIVADHDSHDRFLQEIRAMGRLQSAKNIVPIYHVGQWLNCLFYVMPFLAGGSLSKQRSRFPSDPRSAVALLEKVARAVHQLHQNKVLHRDIKPSNILLDADQEPYLSDFGLAKLLDQDQSLTGSQNRLGTPAYMAPEQTGLLPTPMSPQTDIWALGVVLYELLTGTRPFLAPDAEVSTTLLWKIVNESPPQPRNLRPDLDSGLEAVILKCLEKRPADRFATAAELADELERWLQGESLKTPRHRWYYRVRHAARKRPVLCAVLALLAFLVIIGSPAVWYVRSPERPIQGIQSELEAGRSVTLIPEQGLPAWTEFLHGGDDAETSRDKQGYFNVKSDKVALVRLVREVPAQAYRLRGKIRHDTSDRNGRVGVFWGHHAQKTTFGKFEFYYQVMFNDFMDNNSLYKPATARPVQNAVSLNAVLYAADVGAVEPRHIRGSSRSIASFKSTQFTGGKWRDLAITVQPKQIKAQFDQEPEFVVAIDDELRLMRSDFDRRANAIPANDFAVFNKLDARFRPDGALGIVIHGGSAAFSNFILEPIPTDR